MPVLQQYRHAMVGSVYRRWETAMCHMCSYEYDKRLGTEPTRSFFQALRDLFRRTRRPQVEAEVVSLPAEAKAQVDQPPSERAKAA
jgi:hypothetical protein